MNNSIVSIVWINIKNFFHCVISANSQFLQKLLTKPKITIMSVKCVELNIVDFVKSVAGGLFHEIDLAWLEDEQREICIYCARKQRKRGNL